ncbi:MAG: hypothetical protein K6C98_10740 [Treponema sp.]|nr:hypothetical protein [Treponema sp.]
MFISCENITKAPKLPAITLAENCYKEMFAGCTGLTEAPDLPASTLVETCYWEMFKGCTKLNKVVCLATNNISTKNCVKDWLSGVAATGTFIKSSSATSWPQGDSGIPSGWQVENNY